MVFPAEIFLIAVARSKGLLWVPLLDDLPLVETNKSPEATDEPAPDELEPEELDPELDEPPTGSKIHC